MVLLGGALFVGCGDGVSGPVRDAKEAGHEACNRYIDCVLEVTPEAIAPILLSYGPEGECWNTSDLQVLDICKRACEAGREGLEPLAPDFGACGECTEDLHCDDSDEPRCYTKDHVCVECVVDGDCGADELCHPTEHSCVACVDDGDCPGGACDPDGFVCVGCRTDQHCATGVCDSDAMECVECEISSDCAEGVCDQEANACVGCLDESDCTPVEDCMNQQCVEHETICDPGTRRCSDDDSVELCAADGLSWQPSGNCAGEKVCDDGMCVDPVICPDGATDCSFANGDVAVYLCYDGGTRIKKDEDCDANGKTCDAGKCVSTSYGPCTGEDDTCADATNEVCTYGAQGDFYCAEKAVCVTATDCPAPFPDDAPGTPECSAGVCRLRCENSECPLGMTCRADVPGLGVCVWKY